MPVFREWRRSFTECTLGVKYRNEYPDGTVSGGPMYSTKKGFVERGKKGGRSLAELFSVFCILGALGGGNMVRANRAHAQISGLVGDDPGWIAGIVFAAACLFGGGRLQERIFKVTFCIFVVIGARPARVR
ncbi:sodium:alanine symporter family protein [Rhodovulum visakhapatnamense]|uniref:Sodium:alanine symporter family protein n=1 Tax=Rhodovulum visakhapatnamense TaxID=364297 RepID=A0A4R8FZX3_9RHOB|nr:sodium:alanine symporter family protein [Rhodovulum visakhapatnamense]